MIRIRRRVGTSPKQRGSLSGSNCPDVFELDSGDYLVIGHLTHADPAALGVYGASVGDDEAAVIVPRDVLHAAVRDIVAEQIPETAPCAGFPDRCPNLVEVQPRSPFHGGGIRCGCTKGASS